MRYAQVEVGIVRHCPHWVDGKCLNSTRTSGGCNSDGFSEPPESCPLPKNIATDTLSGNNDEHS